ncbi:MAG: flagellar basal body P-ring formation chaperone FlgA [Bacteriovoracales bacterium]|nr:flagellar basal body P-ring formation chaperone FlgA [Bacteriovoracales bacterium]
MKKKLFTIFISFFLLSDIYAKIHLEKENEGIHCFIETFPNVLFLQEPKKKEHFKGLVLKSNCPERDLNTFWHIAWKVDGKISSHHLNRLIREEGHKVRFELRPNNIKIFHLDKIVLQRIIRRKDFKVKKIGSFGSIRAIGLRDFSDLKFECHACHTTGLKNLNINYIAPESDYQKNIWVTLKLSQLKKVAVASSDIHPFSEINLQDVVEIMPVDLEVNNFYIQSVSDLKYFKVNKYVARNTPLKHSDLIPKILVGVGKSTHAIVVSGRLKLKMKAIAKENGKYGEFIALYNPDSKKQIRGRVIDFNKVQVDI